MQPKKRGFTNATIIQNYSEKLQFVIFNIFLRALNRYNSRITIHRQVTFNISSFLFSLCKVKACKQSPLSRKCRSVEGSSTAYRLIWINKYNSNFFICMYRFQAGTYSCSATFSLKAASTITHC